MIQEYDQEIEKRNHPENFEPELLCEQCGNTISGDEDPAGLCEACAKKNFK